MKRLTYLFLAISILICSCSTFDEPRKEVNINLGDLYAGFDEDTRTYVKNDKYLRWNEGDCLTVFYGNTLNCQYKFNGATGDNSGSFSYVSSGDLETGNALDRIYAVYPYNETATITDGGQISLTLPAVQTYAENSFGRGANTMLAVTRNVEGTFLAFKNACGYLKLKLYNADGATIKSIVVKGNGEEKIAGSATATIAFGEAPQLTMTDDATTTITLDCGDGVALGTTEETATAFWVVIPETTFESGITVTVTDTEGGIFEKSTNKEVVIERNAIQPMEALGVEFVAPVVKPANNEIWYTATMKVDPYKTDAFDANIVSNEWNESTGEGVITFDGEVTSIGKEAFYWRDDLTSITIPDSVTKIGERAFSSSRLTSVTMGDFVTEIGGSAFSNCSRLTSVIIPNNVTTIRQYAFSYCTSLSSVTIPDSVIEIESSAFFNCSCLTSLTIGDGLTTIGEDAFSYCTSLSSVTIPDSVTTIGNSVFNYCWGLTSVTIPDGVTNIGYKAFFNCRNLTSVTIGDSVTTIGYNAFHYCINLQEFKGELASTDQRCLILDGVLTSFAPAGLTEYTIPDSVTEIGEYAFGGCENLTSVTIPNSVTKIGEYAFNDCSSLTSMTIPNSVTKIENGTFIGCSSLTSVSIPNSVTTIGGYAFNNCSSITSVYISDIAAWCNISFESYDANPLNNGASLYLNNELVTDLLIPDNVTAIRQYAFYDCSSLTSVTIPDGITTIESSAFSGCSSLTSITIPNSVTTIGAYAFNRCSSLEFVYCKPIVPPSLESTYVFNNNASGRKIYVPTESIEEYKAAENWCEYADVIVAYDFDPTEPGKNESVGYDNVII